MARVEGMSDLLISTLNAGLMTGSRLLQTVIIGSTLCFFNPAFAERGWVCTEMPFPGNVPLVQKYHVNGKFLKPEGDFFSNLAAADAKATGKPSYGLSWTIIVNNEEGIVAVMADSSVDQQKTRHVWSDTLLIDKKTGRFRHVSGETGTKPEEVLDGNCTDY